MILLNILYVLIALLVISANLILALRSWLQRRKQNLHTKSQNSINVGIFHPYCNAGGGGERVLWCVVRSLQAKYDNVKIIIYTGDIEVSPNSILEKTRDVFNINIEKERVNFVFLKYRHWIEPQKYPYFTLLAQSIASILLGLEALCKFPPDVYLDTMGYAFTYPLFHYLGICKIGSYTHYPIISTDMLKRVQKRQTSHNNKQYVARNPFLTWLKVAYYRLFANLYRCVGRCADTIMVNSTWTENHILELWEVPFKTHRVYPPCEVDHLKNFQRIEKSDEIIILSVGQFRPEKDHPLQLQTMYELRTLLERDENLWNKIRLIIVGSCRSDEDYERLKNMQDLSKHLALENSIEFKVNVSYNELLQLYRKAKIGIHTMWNEHFGIGIVDSMAAGLIMIAHRSGGPLLDIIETSEGSQNGYLAADAIEYARCILTIIHNTKEENDVIRNAAMSSVERFSEKEFENNFLRAVSPLFNKVP